jgi:hypothetical protein
VCPASRTAKRRPHTSYAAGAPFARLILASRPGRPHTRTQPSLYPGRLCYPATIATGGEPGHWAWTPNLLPGNRATHFSNCQEHHLGSMDLHGHLLQLSVDQAQGGDLCPGHTRWRNAVCCFHQQLPAATSSSCLTVGSSHALGVTAWPAQSPALLTLHRRQLRLISWVGCMTAGLRLTAFFFD